MGYNVLIADDDLEDLELIEEAILHITPGVELKKFTDGQSVIEYLNLTGDDDLPLLIMLDYNMPQLNGSQLLSAMKAQVRYQSIPKIVLSTSNAPMHIRECMNNGATEYVEKPDSIEELYKLAARLLTYCKKD